MTKKKNSVILTAPNGSKIHFKQAFADKCLELAEKATEGPWRAEYDEHSSGWPGAFYLKSGIPLDFGMDGEEGIYADNKYDLEFIAQSRTMVPELARRLNKAISELRDHRGLDTDTIKIFRRIADELEALPEEE